MKKFVKTAAAIIIVPCTVALGLGIVGLLVSIPGGGDAPMEALSFIATSLSGILFAGTIYLVAQILDVLEDFSGNMQERQSAILAVLHSLAKDVREKRDRAEQDIVDSLFQ